MTILMGLYTNRAYAIAPGLGLNAVVAFGLVVGEGLSFPAAMGLIVVEGIAVTILVLTGMREKIMDAIPLDLKKAIAIGIGLFIAFIGLTSAGIVVRGEGTVVDLGRLTTWPVAVTFFGLFLTIVLRARGVRGDLLIGIIATTILATIINEADDEQRRLRQPARAGRTTSTRRPTSRSSGTSTSTPSPSSRSSRRSSGRFRFSSPTSSTRWARSSAWASRPAISMRTAAWRTSGNRSSSTPSRQSPAARRRPRRRRRTSSPRPASGSAAGPAGSPSSAGALFFPFMFFAPIIGMVPPQATAPALIIVGFLMMTALTEAEEDAEGRQTGRKLAGIDFTDLGIGLAAALTIMFMPFTFSITDGIGIGFLAFVTVRAAQGRPREVHPFMWIASAAFLLYFLVPFLQDTFDWI